jgi:hypothetical protein
VSLYRLWQDGEDYGTASEWVAGMWLSYVQEAYPCTDARIEKVPDDAPVFLARA